jgi:hypothetical protein
MVLADLADGLSQRIAEHRRDPLQRLVPIRRVQLPGSRRKVHTVELEGVRLHGSVAPGQDVPENIGDYPPRIRIGAGLAGKQRLE